MERLRRLRSQLGPAAAAGTASIGERQLDHRKVHDVVCAVLAAGGASKYVCQTVADHLVEANLRGHDSHGIQMISKYMKAVKQGTLVPNAPIKVVKDEGPVLVVDGGQDTSGGFGQVSVATCSDGHPPALSH